MGRPVLLFRTDVSNKNIIWFKMYRNHFYDYGKKIDILILAILFLWEDALITKEGTIALSVTAIWSQWKYTLLYLV